MFLQDLFYRVVFRVSKHHFQPGTVGLSAQRASEPVLKGEHSRIVRSENIGETKTKRPRLSPVLSVENPAQDVVSGRDNAKADDRPKERERRNLGPPYAVVHREADGGQPMLGSTKLGGFPAELFTSNEARWLRRRAKSTSSVLLC